MNDDHILKHIAKRTPTALGGLMLGLASLGNLVLNFKGLFGSLAFILFIVILNKIFFDFTSLLKEIFSPTAGVLMTIPVGLSVLTTYLKPFNEEAAKGLWMIFFTIGMIILVFHSFYLLEDFRLTKFNPSTFVVYVGYAVNSFIAYGYKEVEIAESLFWMAFICFVIILPLITYRVIKEPLKNSEYPMLGVFTSPASVLLNAYVIIFQYDLNETILKLLFVLSFILWLFVLSRVPYILKLPFYPSFASLTFPSVISATAMTNAAIVFNHNLITLLSQLATIVAFVLVICVLLQYTYHFIIKR